MNNFRKSECCWHCGWLVLDTNPFCKIHTAFDQLVIRGVELYKYVCDDFICSPPPKVDVTKHLKVAK